MSDPTPGQAGLTSAPPMRHDPDLTAEAVRRFRALLEDVAVAPPP